MRIKMTQRSILVMLVVLLTCSFGNSEGFFLKNFLSQTTAEDETTTTTTTISPVDTVFTSTDTIRERFDEIHGNVSEKLDESSTHVVNTVKEIVSSVLDGHHSETQPQNSLVDESNQIDVDSRILAVDEHVTNEPTLSIVQIPEADSANMATELENGIRSSVNDEIQLEQNPESAAIDVIDDIPEPEAREKFTEDLMAMEYPQNVKKLDDSSKEEKLPAPVSPIVTKNVTENLKATNRTATVDSADSVETTTFSVIEPQTKLAATPTIEIVQEITLIPTEEIVHSLADLEVAEPLPSDKTIRTRQMRGFSDLSKASSESEESSEHKKSPINKSSDSSSSSDSSNSSASSAEQKKSVQKDENVASEDTSEESKVNISEDASIEDNFEKENVPLEHHKSTTADSGIPHAPIVIDAVTESTGEISNEIAVTTGDGKHLVMKKPGVAEDMSSTNADKIDVVADETLPQVTDELPVDHVPGTTLSSLIDGSDDKSPVYPNEPLPVEAPTEADSPSLGSRNPFIHQTSKIPLQSSTLTESTGEDHQFITEASKTSLSSVHTSEQIEITPIPETVVENSEGEISSLESRNRFNNTSNKISLESGFATDAVIDDSGVTSGAINKNTDEDLPTLSSRSAFQHQSSKISLGSSHLTDGSSSDSGVTEQAEIVDENSESLPVHHDQSNKISLDSRNRLNNTSNKISLESGGETDAVNVDTGVTPGAINTDEDIPTLGSRSPFQHQSSKISLGSSHVTDATSEDSGVTEEATNKISLGSRNRSNNTSNKNSLESGLEKDAVNKDSGVSKGAVNTDKDVPTLSSRSPFQHQSSKIPLGPSQVTDETIYDSGVTEEAIIVDEISDILGSSYPVHHHQSNKISLESSPLPEATNENREVTPEAASYEENFGSLRSRSPFQHQSSKISLGSSYMTDATSVDSGVTEEITNVDKNSESLGSRLPVHHHQSNKISLESRHRFNNTSNKISLESSAEKEAVREDNLVTPEATINEVSEVQEELQSVGPSSPITNEILKGTDETINNQTPELAPIEEEPQPDQTPETSTERPIGRSNDDSTTHELVKTLIEAAELTTEFAHHVDSFRTTRDETGAIPDEIISHSAAGRALNAIVAEGLGKPLPTRSVGDEPLSSSYSSEDKTTTVVVLCSSVGVIFVAFSIAMYLITFQRQHGTLDIEMQEQKCGKDGLEDEEDAETRVTLLNQLPPVDSDEHSD